jgi:hypothetical protein
MADAVTTELKAIKTRLSFITKLLLEISTQGDTLMAQIQDVFDAVESETSVVTSVLSLVDQLVALVKAAGADPVKIDMALATIQANKDRIAASVVANTPAG